MKLMLILANMLPNNILTQNERLRRFKDSSVLGEK